MKKILPAIVIALVILAGAILLLAGNDSSDKSSDSNTTNQNSSQTNTQQPQSTNSVNIVNLDFSPKNITVKAGSKVTWTNNDSTVHTVTKDSGSGPDSPTLAPGQSYSFTFDSPGTYSYHCTIHPSMTGTVTVT